MFVYIKLKKILYRNLDTYFSSDVGYFLKQLKLNKNILNPLQDWLNLFKTSAAECYFKVLQSKKALFLNVTK